MVSRVVSMFVINSLSLWKVLLSVDSTFVTSIMKSRYCRNFSDCSSFRIPLARCPYSSVLVLCCTCMTVGKCFSRAHSCPMHAGQPSCFLYSTVINNIFLENVCSFVALIRGVKVKFKAVLDGCSGSKRQ